MEREVMMTFRRYPGLIGLFALGLLAPAGWGAEPSASSLITRIKAVRNAGTGNEEAAKAWRGLVRLGPDVLPELLTALNDAEPIAANWLRSAVDAIAERVAAMDPPPARNRVGSLDDEAGGSESSGQFVQGVNLQREVRSIARGLVAVAQDADMKLTAVGQLEPDAVVAERCGLDEFPKSEERSVELPCLRFAPGRRQHLDMMQTDAT